jgi:hypothetical protein
VARWISLVRFRVSIFSGYSRISSPLAKDSIDLTGRMNPFPGSVSTA